MILSKKPPYESTTVDPDVTQQQITKLLRDYGVMGTQWTTRYDLNQVSLAFIVETEIGGVRKQITVQVTPPLFVSQRRVWDSKKGYVKINAPNWKQSMRLLFYWLKAKLEAVSYGLASVEQEFLSQVLYNLPDGRQLTVGALIGEKVVDGSLRLEAKEVVPQTAKVIEVESSEEVSNA